MSVARGFGLNGKSFYTNVVKPVEVNMAFTVTPTNGLGITSLKANGYVENVFMHTSTTPTANNGFTNPNPANGYAVIQLKQNFNTYLGMRWSFQVPTATDTKVDNSALTVGNPYVITTLGNTTAAQWLTLGVPAGVTPAVGVAFVALLVGVAGEANTSTSKVQIPGGAAIVKAEMIGNPNVAVTSNIASNAGQQLIIQFSSATATVAAPTTASICSLQLYFDASSVTIDGL